MKYLLALLLLAASAVAQISGAGSLGCNPNAVAGTVWDNTIGVNSVQPIIAGAQSSTFVLVTLETTGTITAGEIQFQVSYDGTTYYPALAVSGIYGGELLNFGSYLLTGASASPVFAVPIYGAQAAQMKLTTAIVGTGNLTSYFTTTCAPQPQAFDGSGNLNVNVAGGSNSTYNPVITSVSQWGSAHSLLGTPSFFGTSPGASQTSPSVNASLFQGTVAIGSAAPLNVTGPIPSTIQASQQAVTASAVALATNTLVNGLCIEALSTNLISVFIGPSGVTTSTGLELAKGATYCPRVSNSNAIYVIASTTGASVSWSGN